MEQTKKCPYCGEEILAVANKCKHCGEWLDKGKPSQQSKSEKDDYEQLDNLSEHYSHLVQDALNGNKSALRELDFKAGAGNAEAQYAYALYYGTLRKNSKDGDCQYWLDRAVENGFVSGQAKASRAKGVKTAQSTQHLSEDLKKDLNKDFWKEFGTNILWAVAIGIPLFLILDYFDVSGKQAKGMYVIIVAVCAVIGKVIQMFTKNKD